MEYQHLFRALFNSNIRYVVAGGLAVNLYGIPRMTADIDLVVDLTRNNLANFDKLLQDLNYKSSIPVLLTDLSDSQTREQLKKEKHLIAISYYHQKANYMAVDILLDVPVDFDSLWANKATREMEDFKVYFVSLDHLKELKKYANRKQDIDDLNALESLNNG